MQSLPLIDFSYSYPGNALTDFDAALSVTGSTCPVQS